jgi:hypothetical protein
VPELESLAIFDAESLKEALAATAA